MCGSGSYDRDYDSEPSRSSGYHDSSSGFSYSFAAQRALYSAAPVTPRSQPSTSRSSSTPTPKPVPVKPKSTLNTSPQQRIALKTKNGVVVVLDLTASVADALLLFWDKLPLLYSELTDKGYLEDFSLSFAGVGDATCDKDPVQVTDFLNRKNDEALKALNPERGGGSGELRESHELAAYYYTELATLPAKMEQKPFMFFVTDEAPREEIDKHTATTIFGGKHQDIKTTEVFAHALAKYEVYALCVPYRGGGFPQDDAGTRALWEKFLPDRTLEVEEPKSVVDLILGIIATATGKRTVEAYCKDMTKRNQTDERVANVKKVLKSLERSKS